MDPALSAGLIIPTYALSVNINEAKERIKHARHRGDILAYL